MRSVALPPVALPLVMLILSVSLDVSSYVFGDSPGIYSFSEEADDNPEPSVFAD